jgi:bacterioferritin-associated ferredoxin
MIVCSCNFLSDTQVKSAIAGTKPRPRMSRVYASLGCSAQCGRCAHTIKNMLDEIRSYVAPENRAIEAITAL